VTVETLFVDGTAHGSVVGVRLPPREQAWSDTALGELADEERAHLSALPELRRVDWGGGRIALRRACATVGVAVGPILPNARGAPSLPAEVRGSVSHKQHIAVALATRDAGGHVGVDVEVDGPTRVDVARHVLTPDETRRYTGLSGDERGRTVTRVFSVKEAIYKALDPFVQRYVGFHEVEVELGPDGTAQVLPRLTRGEGPFAIAATWWTRDGYILATARVTRLA
jgi:4'-phosphopantetheinyl transferase EntD